MRSTTLLLTVTVVVAVLFSSRLARTEEDAGGAPAPIPAADSLGTQRHALVIGVDDYEGGGIPDLRTPENGARGVLSVLVDPLTGGVPEANTELLLGAEATAANVRAALDRLRSLPKEATVFVYFAGHGTQDGEDAYWVMQDSKPDDLPATAVSHAEVRRLLGQVPAERILLIVDCTHAAGLAGEKAKPANHSDVLARYHGPGHATLGAAASEEHSIDAEDESRSVFTHYLVRGLSGHADADDDGVIALSELASYVRRRVGAETRKRSGLERPVVDLEGAPEPSRFLVTIEPEVLTERLLEDERGRARRRERLAALATLHGAERITADQARVGRYLLGVLREGFEPHEEEQRTLFVDLVEGRLDPEPLAAALEAIRRTDRRTLTVPDAFATIQAAIDAANAGDTVFVKAGEYDEHLTFKNGLRLTGEGRERTVIRMVPGKPEILLVEDCAWGAIEGLQFDGTGGTEMDGWSPDGVHLNRSSVRISECIAHSSLGCGMYATGAGCRPYVRESTFERNGQDGVCFSELDAATIVDCICRSNGAVGIQVRPTRGVIAIRACLCELNKHAGIGVCGGSRATLEGNECRRNGGHGILAWDKETSVTLEGNTCSRNEIHGIYLVQRSAAVANGNTCSRNRESGFVVSGAGTRATIVGSHCLGHDLTEKGDPGGIVFSDGAHGEVTSCTCEGNIRGILVKGHNTSVRLRDNECRKNKTSGIELSDASPGHAAGNLCEENEHGISVSNTKATLEGNTLRHNTKHGIFVVKRAAATASKNRCEENEQAGIHVTGVGTRAELLKNTCVSNGSDGIQFALGASGTADGNECSENKGFGIAAYTSGTRPTFRRNRCTNNGRAGIGKQGGASPVVESDNVESGNGK